MGKGLRRNVPGVDGRQKPYSGGGESSHSPGANTAELDPETDALYELMRSFSEPKPINVNLPPMMENAGTLIKYFDLWVLYAATGRRFLPDDGGILDQDAEMLDALIQLDGLNIVWREKWNKQKKGGF